MLVVEELQSAFEVGAADLLQTLQNMVEDVPVHEVEARFGFLWLGTLTLLVEFK